MGRRGRSRIHLKKQTVPSRGCVLTATIFSVFLSAMLGEAFREIRTESTSNYNADLFTVAQLRAKTKILIYF